MKKVVIAKKPVIENLVYIEDLVDDDIIGIECTYEKFTVIRCASGFIALNSRKLDISKNYSTPTLRDYLSKFPPTYKNIYKFDSTKELFKWLSE